MVGDTVLDAELAEPTSDVSSEREPGRWSESGDSRLRSSTTAVTAIERWQTRRRAQIGAHRNALAGDRHVADAAASLRAVAHEVLNDIRLDGLGLCDVGIAVGCVTLLELGKSASIERTRQLRVQSQRRTIIVDG
jgi:hypothetical protein